MVDAVRPPSSADARATRLSGRAGACWPAPASRGTWEFDEGQSTSPLLLSAVAQSTAGCTPIRRPHQSIVPPTEEPSSDTSEDAAHQSPKAARTSSVDDAEIGAAPVSTTP
jgi:hypothetical protein